MYYSRKYVVYQKVKGQKSSPLLTDYSRPRIGQESNGDVVIHVKWS